MPLFVHGGQDRPRELPPTGAHYGVCVDVIDMGVKAGTYGPTQMVKLIWEIEALRSDNSKFQVNRIFYLNVGPNGAEFTPKTKMRLFLESWRNAKYTDAELASLDLERCIGRSAQLIVKHEDDSQGRTWANVTDILAYPKDRPPVVPSGTYKRPANKPPASAAPAAQKPATVPVAAATTSPPAVKPPVSPPDVPF